MRISDWSSDVCSSDLAERRVAKNDGYVLLWQLDASEVSDDDLSAGIGFGDSGDIGINIYTIGRQMLRDCAQEADGATGRLDNTNKPESGRATGRARVCQNTYISEVAGSQKKKN